MRRLVKPMQNTRSVYPSVVFTSTKHSIKENHLRTNERILSVVKSMPAKFVNTFLPCTSSHLSFILRKLWSSSLFKSAREISKIRPFKPSEAIYFRAKHRSSSSVNRSSNPRRVASRRSLGLLTLISRAPYLGPLRAAHERLADVSHGEHARRLNIIPILLRERVNTARRANTWRQSSSHRHSASPKRASIASPSLSKTPISTTRDARDAAHTDAARRATTSNERRAEESRARWRRRTRARRD